jgi:hypothetical protein
MTYPHDDPSRYPAQSSAADGAYWPQFTSAATQPTSPPTQLVWVVLVLGLTTYCFSYAAVPPDGTGWGVRFSALAAIVAALGLLPRQSAHTRLMTALAAIGFLDALSALVTGDQNPHWATIVIVVLVALQTLAAIGALLTQLRALGGADRGLAQYEAYAHYAQAAQQYYAVQNQPPQRQPMQAQGTAQAKAAATAQARQSTAQRDALYAQYFSPQQPGPSRATVSAQSDEHSQTAQPSPGIAMPISGSAESIRPGGDPATGSTTQSFS